VEKKIPEKLNAWRAPANQYPMVLFAVAIPPKFLPGYCFPEQDWLVKGWIDEIIAMNLYVL